MATREEYEEWYEAQLNNSGVLVQAMEEARTAIVPVANDLSKQALAIIQDTLPLAASQNLTPSQHKAAFLVGCGVEWSEAERLLRLKPGTVLNWRETMPEFRGCAKYYRDVKTEEIQGKVLRNIELLIGDPNLDPKVMTSVVAVAQKLASDASRDRLAQAQIALQVEALNRQDQGPQRPRGLAGAPRVVDAEYEVVEDGDID